MNQTGPIRGILCSIALSALTGTVQSQPLYGLQYPFETSPKAGSEFHLLLHDVLGELDNRFVPAEIFHGGNRISSAGNILYRLVRMGSYEFYMAYIPVVNQHEYFGHLARAKQHEAGFTRYEIYFFPPSGGRAYFGNHKYHPLTGAEMMSENIGGMEANAIMAESMRIKTMQKGTLSFQDAMLYLGSRSDFITYVLFEDNGASDDIMKYLQVLNLELADRKEIERKDLVFPSVMSGLLDPYTLKCVYSLIVEYLLRGHVTFETPFLWRSAETGFLPLYSFEAAAGVPRHYLTGYLIRHDHLFRLSLHGGAFGMYRDHGTQLAVYGYSLDRKALSFDLDLRYWHSEKQMYHDDTGMIRSGHEHGGLVSGMLHYRLPVASGRKRNWFLSAGIHYKTAGYTSGYELDGGVSFTVGAAYGR
ncbi:MAG TPA: hypothetical protein ENO20_08435 [Bacteroides sp.]|nr:hypothetical protein [Bacteroides sp.]